MNQMTMTRCIYPMVLFAATIPCVGEAQPPSKSTDAERIQGTWIVVSYRRDGQLTKAANLRITFDKKSLSITNKGKVTMRLQYKLVPSSESPRGIDTTHRLDPQKPISQLGIYVLEKDSLRLCIEAAEKPRPKNFETPTGSVFLMRRLQRR